MLNRINVCSENKVSASLQEPRIFIDRFCNFRTIPLRRIPYKLFSWTNLKTPKTSTGRRPIGSGGKRKGGVEVRSWDKRQVPSGNQGVPEAEARTVQRSTQGRDLRGMEAYHSAAYSLQTSSHVTANKSDRPGEPASERRRCVASRGRGKHSSYVESIWRNWIQAGLISLLKCIVFDFLFDSCLCFSPFQLETFLS